MHEDGKSLSVPMIQTELSRLKTYVTENITRRPLASYAPEAYVSAFNTFSESAGTVMQSIKAMNDEAAAARYLHELGNLYAGITYGIQERIRETKASTLPQPEKQMDLQSYNRLLAAVQHRHEIIRQVSLSKI